MFKVHTTETLLNAKLDNLCTKLQKDHGVTQDTIDKLKTYFTDSNTSLTAFCRQHLSSHHHPPNTHALAQTLVSYANIVDKDKEQGAVELVQSYLGMFAALVC
jgi:hypothetical protein